LNAVDVTNRKWVMLNMTKIEEKLAPSFHPSYKLLMSVMQKQEMKQAIKAARLAARQEQEKEQEGQQEGQQHQYHEPEVLPPPPMSMTTEGSRKRTHNLTLSMDQGSSKRIKQEKESSPALSVSPKTPNNPIPLPNADYTGTTSEVKDETTTADLLRRFLADTLTVLKLEFRQIAWQKGESELVELVATYLILTAYFAYLIQWK
jgi:hypothetical protein